MCALLISAKENKMIVYENEEIVCILILISRNRKTGSLSQLYILDKETLKGGFCSNCTSEKICYVFNGLKGVQDSYRKGNYPHVDINLSRKRVRLGAYGDPALIPLEVLRDKLQVRRFTGYTHMWRLESKQEYKSMLMASVEDIQSYHLAKSLGWRVFYNQLDVYLGDVTQDQVDQETRSILCPNTTHEITCDECMLCDGRKSEKDTRKDIFIHPHGGRLSKKNARHTLDLAVQQNQELLKTLLLKGELNELEI